MLSAAFFVVHDTIRGGQHEFTELTGGQQTVGPLFHLLEGDVEARRDDTALIQTADEVDYDLSVAVIVDDFKFTDVFCENKQQTEVRQLLARESTR